MVEDGNRVGATVAKLASEHGVVYIETDLDAFAEVATRLAGDSVELDGTERLMLALARAGVIDRAEAVSMFVKYGREKKLAAAIKRKRVARTVVDRALAIRFYQRSGCSA